MGDKTNILQRISESVYGIVDTPVSYFKDKIVQPFHDKNKSYYYHRRFRRVPTIDECYRGDPVCHFEANQQFKRDKLVDSEVLRILRQRKIECMAYEGPDMKAKCKKVIEDYEQSATNWFIKYGDLGATGDVLQAYMKQKHRMIWMRRNPDSNLQDV